MPPPADTSPRRFCMYALTHAGRLRQPGLIARTRTRLVAYALARRATGREESARAAEGLARDAPTARGKCAPDAREVERRASHVHSPTSSSDSTGSPGPRRSETCSPGRFPKTTRVDRWYGAPGGTRTPGLQVRSLPLYPTELRAHTVRPFYRATAQERSPRAGS